MGGAAAAAQGELGAAEKSNSVDLCSSEWPLNWPLGWGYQTQGDQPLAVVARVLGTADVAAFPCVQVRKLSGCSQALGLGVPHPGFAEGGHYLDSLERWVPCLNSKPAR